MTMSKENLSTNSGANQGANSGVKQNSGWVTALLIIAVVLLAAIPMFFNFGDKDAEEPFSGTDGAAGTVVEEIDPEYTPWFEPLVGELPGEVESGLFALQAAIGSGFLFYVLGYYRGRNKGVARGVVKRDSVHSRDVES